MALQLNTDAVVTGLRALGGADTIANNEQALNVSDQTIPSVKLQDQALYNALNQANVRVGQMGPLNAEAQPIPHDLSNVLDKQIIRLNNYIQSVTQPNVYLLGKLNELAKIRATLKSFKEYYIKKFLRLGYSESESISMATAIVNPLIQAELKIYQDLLPDKITDLALQISRQTSADRGISTSQAMINAGV